MATQYDTQIQQLYVAYFNRPADASGIAFWTNAMANGTTVAQISAAFAQSLEYQVEYSQSTNAGIVNAVYQNLFGRPAEADGLAFWVKALNDKSITVDNMVEFISRGAQGSDKVAFDSKVVVATAFTNALNTEAEKAGYAGTGANDAAKELLAGITTAKQATDAIVPATLDANVAAVIKAGVPFTLESGLAALGAAQDAEEAFYEDFADANDLKTATKEDVTGAVDEAEEDLIALIEDEDFADASEGVQAALIADQEELNSDTLVAANAAAKKASDAVAAKTGLANAIASSTSAEAGVEAAGDSQDEAEAAYAGAWASFDSLNPTVQQGTSGGLQILTDAGKTIASQAANGTWKVATGVTASKYPGLTAFVTAANDLVAANEEVQAAQEAATLAQLRVEMIDLEAGALTANTFDFTITEPAAENDIPTYNEVINELSALTSASVTADARVAAADPASTGYAALVTAANTARSALSEFKGDINAFIRANDTVLADAVTRAEEGTIAEARAAIADVDGLTEAVEAAEVAAKALEDAREADTAAQAAFDEERAEFAGAGTDITVNDNGTAAFDDGTTQQTLIINGTNGLELAVGVDDDTYPGVEAMLAAAIANAAAAEALSEATTANTDAINDVNALDPLVAGVNLRTALVEAQADATSADPKVRAEALGTEGAQDAIEALAEAREALEDAQAVAKELEGLEKAVAAAEADFEANDYAAPIPLAASGFGTTDADIFVAGTVNSTVTNFGRSGDDVLYVGSGFTLNEGKMADGNDSVMEVFFTQSGNNAVITIESKAYGSDSGDVHTVTLTGVSIEDLTFENGIITL